MKFENMSIALHDFIMYSSVAKASLQDIYEKSSKEAKKIFVTNGIQDFEKRYILGYYPKKGDINVIHQNKSMNIYAMFKKIEEAGLHIEPGYKVFCEIGEIDKTALEEEFNEIKEMLSGEGVHIKGYEMKKPDDNIKENAFCSICNSGKDYLYEIPGTGKLVCKDCLAKFNTLLDRKILEDEERKEDEDYYNAIQLYHGMMTFKHGWDSLIQSTGRFSSSSGQDINDYFSCKNSHYPFESSFDEMYMKAMNWIDSVIGKCEETIESYEKDRRYEE